MSWKPTVLHPEKTYLHEAYGITEERRMELCAAMDKLCHTNGDMRIISVHGRLDDVAALARSAEEFTFLVFTHAWWLAKKNALL